MSFDLYRPYLILDIPYSICPAESDRQNKYHLLNLIWIGDVRVLHSEPTCLQTTEHGFDFPSPPILLSPEKHPRGLN
jgi:aspartate carbamoyltransferase catalytic subunit